MADFSWQSVYYSELQSLYALLVVPIWFLAWRAASPADPSRAVVPEAARFVSGLCLFFAFATMIDPISTGPLLRTDLLAGSVAATLIPFFFVLLGDFRVLFLAIGVARPERPFSENFAWAAVATLIVPAAAGACYAVSGWVFPKVHSQVLWMFYEFGFLVLCVFLSRSWTPQILSTAPAAASYLRAIFGFSAAYYALWLLADLLIVVAGLDLGWAVRIVPNQLYYAFWVPFAYFRFFRAAAPGVASANA